jgi:hypothetical protein
MKEVPQPGMGGKTRIDHGRRTIVKTEMEIHRVQGVKELVRESRMHFGWYFLLVADG